MFHETREFENRVQQYMQQYMAVPGKQAAPVVGQAILQQIQRVTEASQKAQSQVPSVVRSTSGGNQAVAAVSQAGVSGATLTVLQVLSTAPGSSNGSGNTAVATTTPVYTYKVRIINPAKKSEVIVRQLNKFNAKFESVTALRIISHCPS